MRTSIQLSPKVSSIHASQPPAAKRHRMSVGKRLSAAALLAASLTTAVPARAEAVMCDGNPLCLVLLLPLALVASVVQIPRPETTSERVDTAVAAGDVKALDRLLRKNPDLATPAALGYALERAVVKDRQEMTKYLLARDLGPKNALVPVLGEAKSVEVLNLLLAHGIPLSELKLKDVHVPANPETLKMILDQRDANDADMQALLARAERNGDTATAEWLRARGVVAAPPCK